MIAALVLMLVQPAMEPAATPVDPEIVVLAERLNTWRGTYKMRRGKAQCRTKTSTGDKAIDAAACGLMVRCAATVTPPVEDALAQAPDKAARATVLATAQAQMQSCLEAEGKDVVAALRAQRRLATTGKGRS